MSFTSPKSSFESTAVSVAPSDHGSSLSTSTDRRRPASGTNSHIRVPQGEKNTYDPATAPVDIKAAHPKNHSSTNSDVRVGKGSPNSYDPSSPPTIVISRSKNNSSTNSDMRLAAARRSRSPSPAPSMHSTHSRMRTSIGSMVDAFFRSDEEAKA